MSGLLIKPYEISVWEDQLVTENNISYYKEVKIAIIGSDTMTSPNKVYEPILTKNINGEVTLTFSLKYKYFDPVLESIVINPFESFLINERKIKLFYDNKWYDFIIRNHSESSDGMVWTYTASDAFVLELSKNGYNVEFNVELNNNQGTALDLAETTLENTDWIVDRQNSTVGKQKINEPIYAGTVCSSGFSALNIDTKNTETFNFGDFVYVFYSYVANRNSKFIQFIRRNTQNDYEIDDTNTIIATNYRITSNNIGFRTEGSNIYITATTSGTTHDIIEIGNLETRFHAYRLAYNQLTTYDPVMQRTVQLFSVQDAGHNDIYDVYKYTDYNYSTSDAVVSYVSNGDNMEAFESGDVQGWSSFNKMGPNLPFNSINYATYPQINKNTPLSVAKIPGSVHAYMEVRFRGTLDSNSTNYVNTIYNSGIEDNAATLGSITKGDEFVFRWRGGRTAEATDPETKRYTALENTNAIGFIVAKYKEVTQNIDGVNYTVKEIDQNGIILKTSGIGTPLNNEIDGGVFNDETKTQYLINGVIEEPSSKYIYKVSGDSTEYIWNGTSYTPKTSSFLDYKYLIATAQRSVSNSELTNPNTKIGFFMYIPAGVRYSCYYYFSDIQLTRYIPDGNSNPVVLGNIPEAAVTTVNRYYVKPKASAVAADIETYSSSTSLIEGLGLPNSYSVVPKYNEDSQKILSISEAQSNCFNILQTIAETFETWLYLDVAHNIDGSLLLDNNYKPIKKVAFKEFAGKDNYAGFKYGINLNTIERTIDSEEIVTKLIVDQAQSDYTDEGVVTIQLADSNPSGESYIFNFDYFINKGLISNRDLYRTDIAEFNKAIKAKNISLQQKQKEKRDLEKSLVQITSKRNVFSEYLATATNNINQALSDFKEATGVDYNNYRDTSVTIAGLVNTYVRTTDINADLATTYYKKVGNNYEEIGNPTSPAAHGYYVKMDNLLDNEPVVEIIGRLYTNSSARNNYNGLLTNLNKDYISTREKIYGAAVYTISLSVVLGATSGSYILKVYFSDYVSGFKFTVNNNVYETTANTKTFDIPITSSTVTLSQIVKPPNHKLYNKAGNEISVNYLNATLDSALTYTLKSTSNAVGLVEQINRLQAEKDAITKEFYSKYSRFIQEGTWSSTEYIDSNLYYLDALQVSNNSAYPQVSYNISVVEISELEGWENYNFDVGDKTTIEDEEFFGWNSTLKAPAREEVIVSEVEWHLDDPTSNSITVQNYKTRFQDLFQRLTATVQTAEYNEATYAKTSSILDANGTLNQNLLLESLNDIRGQKQALTSDGSIFIDGDNIIIQNLNNTANRVLLNSEGIKVSSDGGNTWATAIDGRGINIGEVYTGSLNTDLVTIGNKQNPSFKWDKYGISAYRKNQAGEYDLNTYVRFDEYGLYGIKNGSNFKATSIEQIEETAHFGITWHGFFIRNSYKGGGRVEITSDNDFRILTTPEGTDTEQEKIKIGALEWNIGGVKYTDPTTLPDHTEGPSLYGIRIKNDLGEPVFTTGDDGNIEITGTLNANAGEFKGYVTVGQKDETPLTNPWIVISGGATDDAAQEYGLKAVIQTSDFQESAGHGWMINADGDAVFNNITARGAIKTAVFEYAEIQAVGGLYIFRPSSTIRFAEVSNNDLVLKLEKWELFKVGDWCKISNYITKGDDFNPDNILLSNGLTYVYEVKSIDTTNQTITLDGAAEMVIGNTAVTDVNSLIGGALIDMGNKANGNGIPGTNNYGIGINSSDNVVNLPRRAISLFETTIDINQSPKVTYDFRGILGTLPSMNSSKVHQLYTNNMEGTQGIYTDNMYIGNNEQFVAFYADKNDNNKKKLKIQASQIEFEVVNSQGQTEWHDVADIETQGVPGPPGQDGESALQISVYSTIGNTIKDAESYGIMFAKVMNGKEEVDEIPLDVPVVTSLADVDSGATYCVLIVRPTNTIGTSDTVENRGSATLYKRTNNSWSAVTMSGTYEWTYRNAHGNTLGNNSRKPASVGKCIYIDNTLIDAQITANVTVTLN